MKRSSSYRAGDGGRLLVLEGLGKPLGHTNVRKAIDVTDDCTFRAEDVAKRAMIAFARDEAGVILMISLKGDPRTSNYEARALMRLSWLEDLSGLSGSLSEIFPEFATRLGFSRPEGLRDLVLRSLFF